MALYAYFGTRLSVLPEASSITSNGLEMPIKVSNDGLFSVNDVHFSCRYLKVVASNGDELREGWIHDSQTQNLDEILPGHPITFSCVGGGAIDVEAPITFMELEIDVSFRPTLYIWHENETFKFTGVRGPDGTFHWMPH